MARTPKTPKYKEFAKFSNTFVFDEDSQHTNYFTDERPLVLELGCGKAEPTTAFARKYPDKNFIGIDLKADRLWRPAKEALDQKLSNTVFIKMHMRFLDKAFKENSVSEIWLTFSDPYPKARQEKHRLTHPAFLRAYKKLLQPGGKIFFKTDNLDFFEWSLAQFAHDRGLVIEDLSYNLHSSNKIGEDAKVVTYYEQMFLNEGVKINYCQLAV